MVLFNKLSLFLTVLFFIPLINLNAQESDDKTLVKKLTISQEEIDNNLKPKIKGKKLEELSSPWVGYVSDIEGKVIIIRHNNDGTSVLINFEAKEGDLVHEKDVFDVGPKSSVELTLKNETEISLAPSTTFRMYQHYVDENEQNSLFNLLSGKARINVKKEKKITSIKLYASNVVISSKKADFATSYDDMKKTSMVACLGGEISILGMTDNKERKSYAQFLGEDEYMNITTSYDGETENYINTDPTKMSRNYKKTVLESFSADYRELDPWEFTRISTSFFRIALGLEYANIQELSTRYYNFSIGYLPLIHAFSIFYLEPYFFLSIPSSKELFLRAGTSLVLYLYRGFYAGSGVGAFWITDGAGSKMDLNFSTGYTFSDKQMGIIDGLRFEYFISRTPRYRSNGIILSLVLNFSSGRDEEE